MTSLLIYHNLCLLASVLLVATKSSGESSNHLPLRRRRSNDPFGDRKEDNDFFGDSFDKIDEKTRLMEKFEEGSEMWEDSCVKVGGQQALDRWLEAQNELIFRAMEHFNVLGIQGEIEAGKATGNLDTVFEKYCGNPVERTRPYLEKFLRVSSHCLKEEDRGGLNATLAMVDAAVEFVYYNSGDRIALFMAENGVKCLIGRKEPIISCVNRTVPELFKTFSASPTIGTRRRSVVEPAFAFNRQNCRRGFELRVCVESELLECDDPTPSNIVNALLLAVWNTTPCNRMGTTYSSAFSLSGTPRGRFSPLSLPSLILFVLAVLLT